MHDSLDLNQLAQEVQARAQASKGGVWYQRTRAVALVVAAYLFFTYSAPTALLVGAILAVPAITIFLTSVRQMRRSIADTRRARDVLRQKLPDFPHPEVTYATRFPWQVAALIALLLAAANVVIYQRYVPEWQAVTIVLLALAGLVLAWMSVTFFRIYPKRDANGRAYLRGRVLDWTAGILLVLVGCCLFPAWLWRQFDPFNRDFFLMPLSYVVSYAGVMLILIANMRLPQQWVSGAPLARGDYDGALRRVDFLLRWRPQNTLFQSMRAILLLFAARPEEAERVTRSLVANPETMSANLGVAAINLGYALMGQKRYDEALPLLEAGVHILPEYGTAYSGVAGYYLRQRIEPQRALELMNRGVELTARPKKRKGIACYGWVVLLSGLAEAAALAGDDARADAALNQAFADCDRSFIPALANLHMDAGLIARHRGQAADADSHFAHAAELDPHGYSGQQAREALARSPEAHGV